MTNNKYRVAIAGGGIGLHHIVAFQNLAEQFEVVAVCDLDQAKATQIAATYNIPRVETDFAELCAMDDVDVLDICTPSYLHTTQTQQALAAGKHVICEKPVAGSLKEIDELLRAEAETGKRVMPIFQYRFGHGVQKLKFLMSEGVAGRAYVSTVETAWRRRAEYYAAPWRGKWDTELGGALVTLAVHAHDILCYVLGPVKSVFARTATMVNAIETEDCVSASLEMADGSFASLSVTTGSTVQISRHRFCFSNLTAESNTQPYANTTDPWTFTGDSPELEQQIQETLTHFDPQPQGFEGQFSQFYQALQEGTELPVSLADARISLELITAIYHSAQTGQAVELPLSKHHPKYASWRPVTT
jgi:predicted dehydrogenase